MITVKPYTAAYKPFIALWMELRGLDAQDAQDLPQNGFVCEYDGVATAAGFIRLCEGNYGLIDSYITNPHASAEIRNKALNRLTEHLVHKARELKLKQLFAFTVDYNTKVRGTDYGFQLLPHALLGLGLDYTT
jgi:N-acetylglutamate synthase-like GNAT family acetyltransferase